MCAALANVEEDNWEWHTFDTVKGGDYLVDQDAAEVMCKEAIDAVLDLEKMGLPFNRTPEGRIDQRRFGGHTRNHGEAAVRRSCFAADRTGHMILQTLFQQCVKHGIEFYNEFYVLDLLLNDGRHRRRRRLRARDRRAARLPRPRPCCSPPAASARSSRSRRTRTPSPATAWASSAAEGIPLEDMEFFQFHPTGIWKMGILLTEGARGEGGILRNKDGERFMERYAPTIKDLAPRDMVARAIYTEIRAGRGCGPAGDHVFLDLTHLPPEQLDAKLPDITEFARTYLGIEPYTDPIPIQPTAHYAMGGIPTDIDAQVLRNNTDVVPGLFAAGEVACVSVHGANRLGTNSLLDINVFGRRGGLSAAAYANSAEHVELPDSPAAEVEALLRAAARRQRHRERRGHPRRRCRRRWTPTRPSTAPRRPSSRPRSTSPALKERYANVGVSDRGQRYNTELLEAVELGFLLDLAAGARRQCPGAQRVARRPLPRGLPAPRRRQLHAPHDGLPAGHRSRGRGAPGLQAGRADALPADGAEVLMTLMQDAPSEQPRSATTSAWSPSRSAASTPR